MAPLVNAGIDAHVHLWNRAVDPQDWIDPKTMAPIARDFDASDLGEMLAATGLDGAVLVQSGNSLEESIRLAGLNSSAVVGLVAWVDLAAEVGPQLDRIRENAVVPVVGVRHLVHIDRDPEWLMREEVGVGLAVLEREGLCFDLVVREWQLPQASRLAARHGELRFVLDHLGGPPEPGRAGAGGQCGCGNSRGNRTSSRRSQDSRRATPPDHGGRRISPTR